MNNGNLNSLKIKKNLPFTHILPQLVTAILSIEKSNEIQKIYLFGSYAYGKPNKDSDLDLCVILNDDADKPKYIVSIYHALKNIGINPNYDLLIYRNKYFYSSRNPESVENTIINKGVLLYERKESY